jgi:DNA (cytosine-5)-methyltransferase 1
LRTLSTVFVLQPWADHVFERTLGAFASLWALDERTFAGFRDDGERALARHEVFTEFKSTLKDAGYELWHDFVDCRGYGVPQSRVRLVLLASRHGLVELTPPTRSPSEWVTVEQAIGELPAIPAGGQDPDDPARIASDLSEINLRRIRASLPGGSWRDWPEALRAECHVRGAGNTYPSVSGRMEWTKPAPTITTQAFGFGNGRFGHP